MQLNPEQLRNYKLQYGAHKLKNRSSKHERALKTIKSIYRSMSNAALGELSNNGDFAASYEINRRDAHRDRREIRMQRCAEKLAAKRALKA